MKQPLKYLLAILLGGTMLFSACIDELNIETEEEQVVLIVEGFIDTEPGPHTIILSRSAKYGSIFEGFVRKENDAILRIRDQDGKQVVLEEVSEGIYQTPAGFAAQVGNSYTLLIELFDGSQYISTPETIVPVPEINELIPLYRETPGLDEFNFTSGIELYARWNDPESKNYYLWQTEGTYVIKTRPDQFVFIDGNGNRVPAPKECCATCWIYEQQTDEQVRIFSDDFTSSGEITELVAYISDDGGRFQEKYMAAVAQYSLTRDAYLFYSLLNNQLSIDGDIFDPPPATVRGNIINLSDPDANVIGFFSARDVFRDTLFIGGDVILNKQRERIINDDCRILPNSTAEEPSFWE